MQTSSFSTYPWTNSIKYSPIYYSFLSRAHAAFKRATGNFSLKSIFLLFYSIHMTNFRDMKNVFTGNSFFVNSGTTSYVCTSQQILKLPTNKLIVAGEVAMAYRHVLVIPVKWFVEYSPT